MKTWVVVQTNSNQLQAELNKMESEGLNIFQVIPTTASQQQRLSSEMTRDIEVPVITVVAYRNGKQAVNEVDDLDNFNEAMLRLV